ncbi:hypothetical protein [Caldanaerobius polysaccharolyticus]|uniref:hypothetical protein n=1 Tax=Caldanaerobius polysaccharolyticus TaxID=44256 RepID=UPI0004791E92|nr:hypothetical protein [Caldanaerobius polysaccharolyticus]
MINYTECNLDWLAAQHAQKIISRTNPSEIENTVTKALGVLQENGVYACILYLLAKEKGNGIKVVEEMLNLLEELPFGLGRPSSLEPTAVLKFISDKVTKELERQLLAKELLEQMLIYARYIAKAHNGQGSDNNQAGEHE